MLKCLSALSARLAVFLDLPDIGILHFGCSACQGDTDSSRNTLTYSAYLVTRILVVRELC